jgi:hypothetical protein
MHSISIHSITEINITNGHLWTGDEECAGVELLAGGRGRWVGGGCQGQRPGGARKPTRGCWVRGSTGAGVGGRRHLEARSRVPGYGPVRAGTVVGGQQCREAMAKLE